MLLILLIAVPAGIGLAILLELLENRSERIETWIEDAHPVYARPAVTAVTRTPRRPTGNRAKAWRQGNARAKASEHRRAA